MDPISVIFEDDDVVAVNKPSGLLVHAHATSEEETLVDWVLKHYPHIEGVGEDLLLSNGKRIKRPGIVHRLDRETSGVLLIAKNQNAFLFLKDLFQKRIIKKTYRAITAGTFAQLKGSINAPLARSKREPSKKTVYFNNTVGGPFRHIRDAVTDYSVISQNETYAHVEVYPKTGRMHQIRVHLSHINNPILCDVLYGKKRPCPIELGRLALHAMALELVLPSGKQVRLEAEEPALFSQFLAKEGLV
jgi:23S rRNA pseudouridine1911/1915/1917 synthase